MDPKATLTTLFSFGTVSRDDREEAIDYCAAYNEWARMGGFLPICATVVDGTERTIVPVRVLLDGADAKIKVRAVFLGHTINDGVQEYEASACYATEIGTVPADSVGA